MTARVGARLHAVVLDCAEPGTLARFWAQLLGGEVVEDGPKWAAVRLDGRVGLAFQRVRRHRPPNRRRPQQLHLDVEVDDLAAAQARAVTLGAVPRGAVHAGPPRWRVYADPAGHPFCLVAVPDRSAAAGVGV